MVLRMKYWLVGLPHRYMRFVSSDGWYYDIDSFDLAERCKPVDGVVDFRLSTAVRLYFDLKNDKVEDLKFVQYTPGEFMTQQEIDAKENGTWISEVFGGVTLYHLDGGNSDDI